MRDTRSGVLGVVRMRGDALVMDRVSVESDVVTGDTLVTAGIGGIFPPGLLVGWIRDVRKPGASLLSLVDVQAGVPFSRLDYLFFLESQADLPPGAPYDLETGTNP